MFLVAGATGNVGRQVVAQLRAAGAEVRALTRYPAAGVVPPGVEAVGGDLTRPETLAGALAGVEAAFLFPVPGCGPAFVEAARKAHTRKVVLLSSNDVVDGVERQGNAIAAFHAEIEQALVDSGLAWTFLRPGGFAANTLQWAPQIRATGVVAAPYADASLAPIHEADIAAVPAPPLTTDRPAGAPGPLHRPGAVAPAQPHPGVGASPRPERRLPEI